MGTAYFFVWSDTALINFFKQHECNDNCHVLDIQDLRPGITYDENQESKNL